MRENDKWFTELLIEEERRAQEKYGYNRETYCAIRKDVCEEIHATRKFRSEWRKKEILFIWIPILFIITSSIIILIALYRKFNLLL